MYAPICIAEPSRKQNKELPLIWVQMLLGDHSVYILPTIFALLLFVYFALLPFALHASLKCVIKSLKLYMCVSFHDFNSIFNPCLENAFLC